jgi:DNA-binding NarL/FixJ family response regulator
MRIVIAEDAAVMREGLVRLLEDRGHQVVAAVADGDALLESAREHHPDVAVVDIRMPPTHTDEGLRAAIALRREQGTAILVFSQYVETRYSTKLLAEGSAGVGYLLKDRVADVSEFVDALARVAAGGTALDPEVVSQLLGTSRRRASLDALLTPREGEVISLMAEGRSNAGIADRLVISEGAVEKHVANIFAKLGLLVSESDNL